MLNCCIVSTLIILLQCQRIKSKSMMKKILFLCWACLNASVSYAQSPEGYHPIAKEGKVWNYQMDFQKDGNTCQYHYVVRGDTVINDVTYKKVLFERSDFSMYVAAIRDDSHKTFIILYGEDSEILFSALDLDSEGYVYDSIADLQYRYKSTGSVNTDGIPLRKINFTFSPKYGPFPISYNEGYWIEGIGSGVNMDPFLPIYDKERLAERLCEELLPKFEKLSRAQIFDANCCLFMIQSPISISFRKTRIKK